MLSLRSTRMALSRTLSRWSHSVMPTPQAAAYRAARLDQWSGDWMFGASSMTQVLRADLAMLRDKSRDLVMNNATAARLPTLFSENVSGKDGILYQAAVRGVDGQPDRETNQRLEDAWYRWAEDPKAVTVDGRLTWQEVEQLTDESECTDGEVLLRVVPGFKNAWRFALQIIDPDQLDLSLNIEPREGRNAIVMGIEVDEWGAPITYHLWPNHPSDVQRRGDRLQVPAHLMQHVFLTRRAGQMRGVPWLAPVMEDLMHLGKYREAEVIAARIAAAKMGFIKGGTGASTSETLSAVPGQIPKLGADEEFQEWNPTHPNGNYDAFDRAILRSTAGAVRLSYMSMSGDLSQTSYASGRMGWLGEKAVYQSLQQRRILRYSRPVLAAWLPMAILSSQLDVRGGPSTLLASDWRARPFAPVDDLKAANTDAMNLAIGKTCLTDLVEESGGDLRRVFEKRKAEIELARELGVPLYLPVGNAIAIDEQGNTGSAQDAPASPAPARSATLPTLERVA